MNRQKQNNKQNGQRRFTNEWMEDQKIWVTPAFRCNAGIRIIEDCKREDPLTAILELQNIIKTRQSETEHASPVNQYARELLKRVKSDYTDSYPETVEMAKLLRMLGRDQDAQTLEQHAETIPVQYLYADCG